MASEQLPLDLTELVTPNAMKNYVQALGWRPVPGVNGGIAIYHAPTSDLLQLVAGFTNPSR
jgi:hypothetical protein